MITNDEILTLERLLQGLNSDLQQGDEVRASYMAIAEVALKMVREMRKDIEK